MSRPLNFFRTLWLVLPAVAGCSDSKKPEPAEIPVPTAERETDAAPSTTETPKPSGDVLNMGPFKRQFEGVSLSIPKGWQEVKLGAAQLGFVDARFVVPDDEGLVEITCLTNKGGIDDNFNRWVGQFQTDPDGRKSRTLDVDGVDARWIDLQGTFNASSSGKPGPHQNWRMLGVAIPLSGRDFYLKLNGPAAAVKKVEQEFEKMIATAALSK